MDETVSLTDQDRSRYQWQLWIEGFGEEGQRRLKGATVLISRCGGVGGALAYQLAAAGVGRLILAHGGDLRLDDLNRQLLMSQAGLGSARVEQAARRLREFNSDIEIIAIPENIGPENVDRLAARADVLAGCAPLFQERLLLNRAAVAQNKPLVDCAMFELDVQFTTVVPGQTPCLACLYPEEPPGWLRKFPVFGAVAGTIGCLGALEVIKVLTGLGEPLRGQMLIADLRGLSFRKVRLQRNPRCSVCSDKFLEKP